LITIKITFLSVIKQNIDDCRMHNIVFAFKRQCLSSLTPEKHLLSQFKLIYLISEISNSLTAYSRHADDAGSTQLKEPSN